MGVDAGMNSEYTLVLGFDSSKSEFLAVISGPILASRRLRSGINCPSIYSYLINYC